MSRTRFGLQSKIIIIIALTVTIVVGVSTYIAMWLTRLPVEEDTYNRTLAQARLTVNQLADQGKIQDPASVLRVLRQVEHDFPAIKQSDVYLHQRDGQGRHELIASTNPGGEHLELDNLPNIESYNEFERPDRDQVAIETPGGKFWIVGTSILDQGQPIGCLDLKVSKSGLNVITWDLVGRNLLLMLASLAVVTLVLHIFFLANVRRPVKDMIRVMEATEGGQLNRRAGVTSTDEMGELAAHLNRMLERIENFSAELGRKVEEATHELARRNEELKQINEELFETQKNLARSERLAVAGQLAASLAHEIGTPLNSISGHVQLLGRRKGLDDLSQRRLEIIEGQIDSIVRTVKQLLSWTRKFDLRLEPVDLRRLVKDSILVTSPTLQQRQIKVQMDLPRDCPPIYGDGGYLQQVFLNLINNSMDAMPGGGALSVRLGCPKETASGTTAEDQEVVIEVSDTGHGMPPETLARIFEPMFTTKRIGTGAGLGLAICDQIVRQHAGRILVESGLDRGTHFTIILPIDCRHRVEMMTAGVAIGAEAGR